MAPPFPLPRETRNTAVLDGDGRAPATYGPFAFKIFDTADVSVLTSVDGAPWEDAAVTVEKTTADALAFFTVTFPTPIDATVRFAVYGRRLQERETDVTHAGTIKTGELEKELSKQSAVLQETRRDLDRAFKLVPGADPDSALIEPGEDDSALIWKDGRLVGGPLTDEIGNAQGYATEAKAAKEAAESAQAGAVSAAGTAVAAKDAAETAQAGAVAAAGAAVGAKDAAEAAQTAAEDAQAASEGAASDAEDARDVAIGAKDDAETAASTAVGASQDAQTAAQMVADYVNDLPVLGTAAEADAADFATAAQGTKADNSMQIGGFGIGTPVMFLAPAPLNELMVTDVYRYSMADPNSPDGQAGVVLHVAIGESGENGLQIAWGSQSGTYGQAWVRRVTNPGPPRVWTAWRDFTGYNKATTSYVDAAVSGLGQQIAPVRVATTANITLSGTQTIDGVAVVAGNRVLVKNQSTGSQNGVYVVAAGSWARATDSDTWDEIRSKRVLVLEGTTQAGSGWSNTNEAGGTLGTTAVTYQQSVSGQGVSGGSGIDVTGAVIAIQSATLALINGAAQKAVNLSDLPDKPAAQRNLGVSYPTMRYGATGAGGATDKNALTALLDAAASELPRPQIGAKGSIRMSELIPGSDTEPFMDYVNLIWRHMGMEAALRGACFVFDNGRAYYGGTARSASYAQGDSNGYFIPPKEARIEWQRPWEFHNWPLASSPNFIHRTATMGPTRAITGGNITTGTRTFTVGSGHGFVRGDRVRIIATNGHGGTAGAFAGLAGAAGYSGAKAEDHIIHSVTSTTVTTFDNARQFYHATSAAPVMQKYIDEPRLTLINPWLIGPGRPTGSANGGDRAINIVGGRELYVEGGRIEDFGGAWLRLGSIMGGSVRDLYCRGTLDSVDDNNVARGMFYGGAMSDFLFDNCHAEGGGQSFMNSPLGGADTTAAGLGISRRVRHRNLTVKGCGTGAYTQHTEGEDFTYENCDAYGSPGAARAYDIRQPRTKIRGGHIDNFPAGEGVTFRENINGFTADGISMVNVLGGIRLTTFNGNDSYGAPPADITITNNRMRNVGGVGSPGAISVRYTLQDGGNYADLGALVIEGNDVDCSSTTTAIRVDGRWQRPQVKRNNIRDGGTGRSILVNGDSAGVAAGPRSPVVTDNVQAAGLRPGVLVQHQSGTATVERNLVV